MRLLPHWRCTPPLDVRSLSQQRFWDHKNLGHYESVWEPGAKGEGVLVIVGDTGLTTHPDAPQVEEEFVENYSSDSTINDLNGHGSHVTGTILARDNDFGMIGAAPEAGYGCYKLLGRNGSNSSSRIADAYFRLAERWKNRSKAMKRKYHSCVLNLSIGGPPTDKSKRGIEALWEAGIVVIAAMGNEGGNYNDERGGDPGIYAIGVAAYNQYEDRAGFSSVSKYVDQAMPGVNITSFGPNGTFVGMSGTSMASPNASGCSARVLCTNFDPALRTHDGYVSYISQFSFDLGRPGWDKFFGWGKPDLKEQVNDPLFNGGVS